MCCDDEYVIIDSFQVCTTCGIEQPILEHDNFQNNYSINLSFNKKIDVTLLDKLHDDTKQKIIMNFSEMLCHYSKNNSKIIRGENKKAIFSVLYFYNRQLSGETTTCSEVIRLFEIKKSKFGEGKKFVLYYFPQFRNIIIHIYDFTDKVFNMAKLNKWIIDYEIFKNSCIQIDKIPWYNNYNPYSVCCCILFYIITDKKFKKNIFIKKMNISDAIIKCICNNLIKDLQKIN
uniref:Transcription factor TFIIB cyclin-like domain-containing protein n=1 Tax=viral metagenome TaxID=1070528 RepID=A0A6C0JED1_9ZZZZ